MDKQEIFDKVATHLMTQLKRAEKRRVPSYGSAGDTYCRYRTDEGLSCAVGCLIKDEDYSPGMEGRSVHNLNLTYLKKEVYFLAKLQAIHDMEDVKNWGADLGALAEEYGLTPPKVLHGTD